MWRQGQEVEGQGMPARSERILRLIVRFRTLIFWVYEPLENLRPRLDKRVDRMVEVSLCRSSPDISLMGQNGLLREIAEMRHIAERMYGSSDAVDHTEGIFQSIGAGYLLEIDADTDVTRIQRVCHSPVTPRPPILRSPIPINASPD